MNAPTPLSKRCSRPECPFHGKPQPLDSFGVNRSSPDGHHWYCRVCSNAIQLEWKKANAAKVKVWRKRYIEKNKAKNARRGQQMEFKFE